MDRHIQILIHIHAHTHTYTCTKNTLTPWPYIQYTYSHDQDQMLLYILYSVFFEGESFDKFHELIAIHENFTLKIYSYIVA